MSEYVPIEHFQKTDNDHTSARIRDMPYGKHREALMLYPSTEMAFGSLMINRISPVEIILLSNAGYDDVIIEEIIVVGDFIYTGPIITKIISGETLELPVCFTPLQEGPVTGGLYVKAQNAAGRQFVTLSGSGSLMEDGSMEYPLIEDGKTTGNPVNISSGVYAFIVTGTFDGANIRLQWRVDSSSSWIDIPGTIFKEPNTIYGIPLNLGQARAVIYLSGAATSITAKLAW